MPDRAPRIDSHVHVFPDRLARAVRNKMQRDDLLSGGVLAADVAQGVLDAGFDRAWALPYAHREGVAESANEWSASECSQFPSLVPGATFHPNDAHFDRLVHRALFELRLRVVKLHCSVGQFPATDPRLEPLWLAAAELRVPVVVHAGQREPGMTQPDEVEAISSVLAAHPHLRLVLAHCGHPNIVTTLSLMERFGNLYADLTPVWTEPIEVKARTFGRFPGRFLFGSDAPNTPTTPASLVANIEALDLTQSERDSILGGAAASLMA